MMDGGPWPNESKQVINMTTGEEARVSPRQREGGWVGGCKTVQRRARKRDAGGGVGAHPC